MASSLLLVCTFQWTDIDPGCTPVLPRLGISTHHNSIQDKLLVDGWMDGCMDRLIF